MVQEFVRNDALQCLIGRHGTSHHIRGEERGNDRYRHDDGINKVAYHAETQSEGGDDEGELTYLRHGETAAHGILQRLACQHVAERAKDALAYYNGEGEDNNRQPLCRNDIDIHEHADGYEEDGTEEVFYGFYYLLYLVRLDGLCQYATHNECAEGGAEAYHCGYDRHHAAETKGDDEEHLLVHQSANGAQQRRDEKQSDDEPQDYEETYRQYRAEHLFAVCRTALCYGTEEHHHYDGKDVFKYQHAHHEGGKLLLLESEVVERLIYNSSGRHGEHTGEKQPVHLGPAEHGCHSIARQHHAEHYDKGRYDGGHTHLEYLLEGEVQTKSEEQEHHTDVCPRLDVLVVYDGHCQG